MDYLAIRNRVAQEAGMDRTQDDTIIGTWVNAAYQHVSGLFNWLWLLKNTILQTVADITTGTVSVSANSQALTFSSAPSVSVANDYMIQFTTTDDWYYISSHTAASTSATLSVPYVDSSNLTAGTYTLRKVFYSLASDVDRIIDFRQAITDQKLEYVNPRTFDRVLPDPTATGSPYYYSLLGLDSSQYWRVGFYPTPDTIINMQLRYYQKITELSSDTDTPVIPAKWHNVLVFGALALYGHPFIDDTRVRVAGERFRAVMDEMLAHYNHVPDQRIVIQPWDTRARYPVGVARYPSNYPDVYGYY